MSIFWIPTVFILLAQSMLISGEHPISPVILIPGDGGSQLKAKLNNKPTVPYFFCDKNNDWFNLWVNVEEFVPLVVDCWIDNAKLNYDSITRTTSSQPGVETQVPGFGDTSVVEYLDADLDIPPLEYYKTIADALVLNGWIRNKTIRGAPYDFRRGPNENTQWFINTKKLIEDTYSMNDNVPVTIICHSMGCPMSQLLLISQTDEWKNQYIANYITLAGAWGGSVKSVKVFAMGDNLGIDKLPSDYIKPMLISMPSTAFLLPSPHYWKASDVLVTTPDRDYTLGQLNDFFNAINLPTASEMAKDQAPYMNKIPVAPKVPIHCIYGNDLDTVDKLKYRTKDIVQEIPQLSQGKGDGTVNIQSLQACIGWRQNQSQPVSVLERPQISHMDILTDPQVIDYILAILNNYDPRYDNE